MGFVSSLLGIIGFGIGLPLGLLLGFFFFIYSHPKEPEDPIVRPLYELDTNALQDLVPEIPLWVKNPDYDRIDWLNKIISEMWPYIAKVSTAIISSIAEPIIAEYIGKFQIKEIEFESLDLGNLPPILYAEHKKHGLSCSHIDKNSRRTKYCVYCCCFQGNCLAISGEIIEKMKDYSLKVYETNEKELVMETPIRWAGNPNISLVIKVLSLNITFQLVDLQVFSTARITLRPLVPSFPCFSNVVVSLMEKPHVDFGLKILGGDIMSIPGLYRFVQETIKKQIASLFLWPQTLELPVLDTSLLAIKKPVGILRVNVVRARKLLKKDLLGASDPYVKLSLTGESLPAKKTTVKKKTLNPEWNENFKLIVKDPQSQVLRLQVYDWDKVGGHDRLGTQLFPLKELSPYEQKDLTLDLLKDTNISNDKKRRGQIELELTFVPFKENSMKHTGPLDAYARNDSGTDRASDDGALGGAGLLSVLVQGAEEVEGQSHSNPYALVLFRGEKKKTKMIRRTRNPLWNEEFQFMLEEPPSHEKIHVEVFSKRGGFSFRSKESLGHVEINLGDVVDNGRINEKYHLINSKNGTIHVEIRWTTV